MNVFSHFQSVIERAVAALQESGVLPADLMLDKITVEPPRDPGHGDIATNASLVLAGQAGQKPRDIAQHIAGSLRDDPDIETIEIAGPGFINLRLSNTFWQARIPEILEGGDRFGCSARGGGALVNVEYVSANPTGPMHVGHVRGAVVGDALAGLLEAAGYAVVREYYINDAGAQIDTLARSVHLRYRQALGEDIGDIPEGLYPGAYLKPVGEALAAQYGERFMHAAETEWLAIFRDFAIEAMMDLIRDDLAALGVDHEIFFSEKSLHDRGLIEEAINVLEQKGLIYTGILEPPKGKKPEGWEPRPQTLFRATQFGDDVDRPLKKSDGSYTYFAADIAYHYDKIKRGARQLIDILGADHGGYAKRIAAAVRALSDDDAVLDVKLCQLVKLYRGGTPLKMSKRAGTFVTLREVVDEVGKDVVRFMMLTRKNDAPLDFDFEKVKEQSRDNPVFYVQYAHARIHSALRKTKELHPNLDTSAPALATAPLELLREQSEIDLIKQMASWPRTVEAAAQSHEVHRIAFYLYELASQFHAAWNLGNDDATKRFVVENDAAMTRARLALICSVANVIASGLRILGVEPVTEMH